METDKRTEKRKLGDIGEGVACVFLEKNGFVIIEKNYLRKWGEIDIVAKKADVIHFVEVKSVSCVTFDNISGDYRPEDNMHPWKLKRLSRALQTYILTNKLDDREWQVDLIVVFLDIESKKAKIKVVKDIIL